MSYEEIRQAEENDRLDWLAAREAEVRAFADEECPVCDGDGYTTGVTVRHPCPNCNPDFRLDRATDRLVEVGAAAAVHTSLPWEAIEINHDLRRWQIVHFDERRSAHYVTDIAPTYGTGTDEHEANAHLIVEAVNGYAALQERLEVAEARAQAQSERGDRVEDANEALTARAEAAERLNGELVAALRTIISESERPYVGSGFLDWVHATATDALTRIESASASPEEGTQP